MAISGKGNVSDHETITATPSVAGDWGEETEGCRVDVQDAEKAFAQLASDTAIEKHGKETTPADLEAGLHDPANFDLTAFLRNRSRALREQGNDLSKLVPVAWKGLTVKGVDSQSSFVKTLPRAILNSFGPDLIRIVTSQFPALSNLMPGSGAPLRTILHDFTGSLRAEMLLVLGRPGSGCSTFLKAVTNQRDEFAQVLGDVSYAGFSAEEIKRKYMGEVVYNGEDDVHFPVLTVKQTLQFALKAKIPSGPARPDGESREEWIERCTKVILRMFALEHVQDTIVGDAFIRGVSGGERKRVSIAEAIAASAAVQAWDNSTRGLDSFTAIDYVRSLRILTDVAQRTSIVSLYQAGEGIYELFDKVMLIDAGRCIYFGPANAAREYFQGLGYKSDPRETTSDYLTSITNPFVRSVISGYEDIAPRTPEEREAAFKKSKFHQTALADVAAYDAKIKSTNMAEGKRFKEIVRSGKAKSTIKSQPWQAGFFTALKACAHRQVLLKWQNRDAFITESASNFGVSLIVGSLFYGQPDGTVAAFSKSGVIFFSLLFLGWLKLAEIGEAVSGRTVIHRHKDYGLYRPAITSLARTFADIPLIVFQATFYCIIMYWLAGLRRSASAFFIFYLFTLMGVLHLTSFYRAVASLSPNFDTALRFSAVGVNIALIYFGYLIPRVDMHSWFKWVSYVNGMPYAFESLMWNEFSSRSLPCDVAAQVPSGAAQQLPFVGCAFPGATPGSLSVDGKAYLQAAFGYTRDNTWRNFGIVVAFTIAYILFDALASEVLMFSNGGGSTVFLRTNRPRKIQANKMPSDIELASKGSIEEDNDEQSIKPSKSTLTWSNLSYTVGGAKLLNNISGYVKPGTVTALMGPSGAGKTTLLNTLNQRAYPFQVSGEMLIDGYHPGVAALKRGTGFAEQFDVHDETASVREALEFSALLRQPREVPREEKLAYVDKIIRLLELTEIQDAIVGTIGAGLSTEQRKRLTIAVELVARPSLLMFLDEPTSGLDSQGAWSIGHFIKTLSNSGQAVLATIHQPSSLLFTTFFDNVLLLSRGGRTAFFGPIVDIVDYFGRHGAHCGEKQNIAEFMLETVVRPAPDGRSWADIWEESAEKQRLNAEIEDITRKGRQQPAPQPDNAEFAAPITEQCRLLSQRIARNFWRDSSYAYGKLFTAFVLAMFNGFSFFKTGDSIANMQQRVFTIFLALFLLPAAAGASLPKHFVLKGIWAARESQSKTYGWVALVTSLLVNEIPYAIAMAVLSFILAYFPVGFPMGWKAFYSFLMTVLLQLWVPSWIHWLCSMTFSPMFVVNFLPFFMVVLNIMNGTFAHPGLVPGFWRYFLYYVNPMVYYLNGQIGALLSGITVRCSPTEFARFNPPPNQTCASYAGTWAQGAGGYLENPSASSDCLYCQYSGPNQFLASLNVFPDWHWQYLGVFAMFGVTNIILFYYFFYKFQVQGLAAKMTFFGVLGIIADLFRPITRIFTRGKTA